MSDPASVALQTTIDLFALWQGSWYLDQSAGFPWLQKVLGIKNPSIQQIQQLIRLALLSVPGVVNVIATATFNASTRAFAYNFQATLNTGQQILGGSNTPFQLVASGSGAGAA